MTCKSDQICGSACHFWESNRIQLRWRETGWKLKFVYGRPVFIFCCSRCTMDNESLPLIFVTALSCWSALCCLPGSHEVYTSICLSLRINVIILCFILCFWRDRVWLFYSTVSFPLANELNHWLCLHAHKKLCVGRNPVRQEIRALQ